LRRHRNNTWIQRGFRQTSKWDKGYYKKKRYMK
jgi:hypothetical protein